MHGQGKLVYPNQEVYEVISGTQIAHSASLTYHSYGQGDWVAGKVRQCGVRSPDKSEMPNRSCSDMDKEHITIWTGEAIVGSGTMTKSTAPVCLCMQTVTGMKVTGETGAFMGRFADNNFCCFIQSFLHLKLREPCNTRTATLTLARGRAAKCTALARTTTLMGTGDARSRGACACSRGGVSNNSRRQRV